MKSTIFRLIMSFSFGLILTFAAADFIEARQAQSLGIEGCGTNNNCYHVPDGCGEGVGCATVKCDDNRCPLSDLIGNACKYCEEPE